MKLIDSKIELLESIRQVTVDLEQTREFRVLAAASRFMLGILEPDIFGEGQAAENRKLEELVGRFATVPTIDRKAFLMKFFSEQVVSKEDRI